MSDLTQKTLETIKKYLLRQEKQVKENIKSVEKDDPATSDVVAESSEPGTDSLIATAHTSTVALKNQLTGLAGNVKQALSKIKNRTYGKCEKCGKPIETRRLLAMPTAIYCLDCLKKTTRS